MKLVLKILGILIIIIIGLLVAIPYFFRDQVAEAVKQEINKNINAQVDFDDFSLSLFKSFPDFNFEIEGLSIINKKPFAGDTLAYIPAFNLTLDLMSVIRGDAYEVKKITLHQPSINLLVKEGGAVNWDIALPSDNSSVPDVEGGEGQAFLVKLRDVKIQGARIIYDDKPLTTFVLLDGVDHSLSGDFTMDFTSLKTKTFIKNTTVVYDGVKYLNRVDVELDADIDADLVNSIYTLRKNSMRINQLFIGFDGSVAMQENGDINMMLSYNAKKSGFKNFLSLIPAIYAKDFESVQTSGSLSFSGNVKGIYNESTYPAFALNLMVGNGKFQYPDLPKSVDNINIHTKIMHPGGDFDNMVIDVSKFDFRMAGNPFAISLLVKNPMSDPQVEGDVNGELNLSQISEVYPLGAGDKLEGKLIAKISFDGRMSSLENEKYDEFQFLGSLLLEGINYKTSAIEAPVFIQKAQLNFSPEYLDLVSLKMKIGGNDLSAKGKIENFMPYVFNDGMLTGKLETGSTYFNLTELLPESTDAQAEVTSTDIQGSIDTVAPTAIEVPANINFSLNSSFKQLIYDDIEMNNVSGVIYVREQAVILNRLKMDVLDGSVNLSGKYDTKIPGKPLADLNIEISKIDIQKAYHTFGMMEKLAPIAEKTQGAFSTSFTLNTLLDNELIPVYNSMNGGGKLSTSTIVIDNVNTLNKLADILKMADLKRMKTSPINLSFEFSDGKLRVKPFDIKYEDITANIGGTTGFDQSIDYDMKLNVPREKFGGQANAVLDNLILEANKLGADFSAGETIDINVKIGGTITNPQIKTALAGGSGNAVEDLKKKALDELEKQKKKLEAEARKELAKKKAEAKKEADRIIADAKKEAYKILRDAQAQVDAWNKTADKTAKMAKKEAEAQAKNIMDEAKKNGPLAELAAKTATEQLLKEANNNADKIVNEAKNKSNNLLKEAGEQANKINKDARKRADKVLEGK